MLKSIELTGFKSFGRKTELSFTSPIAAIVGPNGSGKSNVAEGFRFVLGEQSMKSMRSKRGEDLIWGGSPGFARSNRAAVRVVFDNSKRLLDLDFQEVVIERVVFRDGTNEYLINGSKVRLKDVIRLLAGANIGGSGYHIISQGEADRILNASPRERREMVEDALGLKLYQHKKIESERKLEETKENIDKVQSLRREIAPHLRFLRTQVEKIEKARELRDELSVKLAEYLARERAYIDAETTRLQDEKHDLKNELQVVILETEQARAKLIDQNKEPAGESEAITQLNRELRETRDLRGELTRQLGRAEGAAEAAAKAQSDTVPMSRVQEFVAALEQEVEKAEKEEVIEHIKAALNSVAARIRSFVADIGGSTAEQASAETEAALADLVKQCDAARKKEEELVQRIAELRREESALREAGHEAKQQLLQLEGKEREVQVRLRSISGEEESIALARQGFEEEVREGIVLVGRAVHAWEQQEIPEGALSEPRQNQEKRRREVERLKIKVEEYGAGNADEVVKEFSQTKERDEFLARELQDLEQSAQSLLGIIDELEAKIDERFRHGLGKINTALSGFFTQLFGGGEARLDLEKVRKRTIGEEDGELVEEEVEPGLAVHVQLPRKKIRGLEVLSGGERALTSIAMIFAMSQVNPPPFLILDETDAALDEANSKRYADMVKILAENSQLILITHNRATMAAAGELYGVTMSADGVSKLLSVKLEEAERVAK